MDKIRLKKIVEDTDTTAGKVFDLFFQLLIIISVISFSLETIPELKSYQHHFNFFEVIVVLIFTVEYMLRIYVADGKIKFIFSFYGIIDLLAILPFYLSLGGLDARSMRIFRLLRLVKLVRYTNALNRIKIAIKDIGDELAICFLLTLFLLYLSSVGIYYFEREAQPEQFRSIFHAMWWSVGTLTTVGYGDVYPVTTGGKIFTFFILMIGLGFIAIPSGLIASALIKDKDSSQ